MEKIEVEEWLEPTVAKEGDDCCECHNYLKEGEECFSNENNCLWCTKCAQV